MYIQFPWEQHITITAMDKKYGASLLRLPSPSQSHPFSFSAFASKAEKYPAHVVPHFSCGMNSSHYSPNLPFRLLINMQALYAPERPMEGNLGRDSTYLSPLPRGFNETHPVPRKTRIRNPDVEF